MSRRPGKIQGAWLALVWAGLPLVAGAEDSGVDFFEKKIRPVLAESCYECHGEKKQKGGLRLDSKAGWEKGGDTGVALVPGQPEKSLLVQAVRYQDHDLAMPPEKNGGKLTPEKIADLEAWVKMGAPDPRLTAAASPARDMAKVATHWSFKPVAKPPVPAVKKADWVHTPVDAFVLARLEEKGLAPAPAADRRTLLRRVYFDLLGLPPTPAQVEAFAADRSPEALAKVVDELLNSPHYGERWGRYWLDIARYADTRGYLGGGEERRFPFSFTYRDYVVRALTDDKPYDQFIREQIAADRLVAGEDQSPLAALGFLTLGRAGPAPDIIDDRIDVVTRGLMGLTVTCARCHDHKFDPIPTADYYSLAGVFQSSQEPEEKPLLVAKPPESAAYQEFLKKRGEMEAKVTAKKSELLDKFQETERRKLGDYLLAASQFKQAADKSKLDTFAAERRLSTPLLQRWLTWLDDPARAQEPVLRPWFALAALPESGFAAAAQTVDLGAGADAAVAQPLLEKRPAALKDAAAAYNVLAGQALGKDAETGPLAALRQLLVGEGAPMQLPREEAEKVNRRSLNEGTAALRREVAALEWSHAGAPMRAMALVDKPAPVNPHILIRGNAGTPGAAVPRQFLEVLSGPQRKPFTEGSGRLELARAIASKDNPLTARVFVNRVWGWHLGTPLVRTPSDFGVRTETPAQVALLDWLSATFMEQGWSIKKLHRAILLSSTYQQASEADAKTELADPDNSLWHRYQRHRLDFESMRDTLLASSGRLDLTVGGQPVAIDKPPYNTRRTVYGFIDRLNLPAVFRTFDFANPDISSPQRFSTTVPQQALFMMNSPFVIEQARALLHRPEIERCASDAERLQAIYATLYQRSPAAEELAEALSFLQGETARAAHPALAEGWQFGSGWYDPLTNQTREFKAFAFADKQRRGPNAKAPFGPFNYLGLLPAGGHPGPGEKFAAIVRWVAPADGEVRIDGQLEHGAEQGDGVLGRIVSARGGKLGEWPVHHGSAPTYLEKVPVKLGETIDFLVESGPTDSFDTYGWNPRVTYLDNETLKLSKRSWSVQPEFAPVQRPAPLTAWETLAQAMLVANEMMFIE